MLGCVVTRVTYRARPDGTLVPTPDEPWPVGVEPADTPLGKMKGDTPMYTGGVDVLVGGRVRQPGGTPRERLDVALEIGRTFRRRLVIHGDRRWVRDPEGQLVASPAEPFASMALDYARAYGGEAAIMGRKVPYGANAAGRGHYLDEAAAEGGPLPNIEDDRRQVARWSDRPIPVGLGYYEGPLGGLAAIDHPIARDAWQRLRDGGSGSAPAPSLDGQVTADHLTPRLFNRAHPEMVIDADKAPKPGDRVLLSHGLRDGDLAFALPDAAFHVYVQLEDRAFVFPLHLDEIGLVAGEGRVVLGFRVVFEYATKRGERRFAALHEGPAPREIPGDYRIEERDDWDDRWWDAEA